MTVAEKPLSKRAQAKARAEEKMAARKQEAFDLEEARAKARSMTERMPAEFGEWGVIRTRAYVKMMEILAYRAELSTITSREMRAYIRKTQEMAAFAIHPPARKFWTVKSIRTPGCSTSWAPSFLRNSRLFRMVLF